MNPDLAPAWLQKQVIAELDWFLSRRRAWLARSGPELSVLLDVLGHYAYGGKLVRPTFCYWGWRAAGGDPHEPGVVRAGASLELLHASALIHDDIIDASDRRRGNPTAHRTFARMHRDRGWRGSAEQFGASAAVLLGDLCLGWSEEVLRTCGLPEQTVTRALGVFDVMRTEMVAGQYLDLAAQADRTTSISASFEVVDLKSGRYTVQRPLQLGVALAGGSPELADALAAYGGPVGAAFQLRDDLLGVFGDPATTGKPVGDDLREGKRTVLLACAYELAGPSGMAVLDRLVGDPTLDQAGIAALQEVLRDCGADQCVEALIAERVQGGLEVLKSVPIREPAVVAALADLATAITDRAV